MSQLQFNDPSLENAWDQVQSKIKNSGLVSPAPGFSERWRDYIKIRESQKERKQALIYAGINLSVALSLFILIVGRILPAIKEPSDVIVAWSILVKQVLFYFNMITSVGNSLLKTLPAIMPFTWWIVIIFSFGTMYLYWYSLLSNQFQKSGA